MIRLQDIADMAGVSRTTVSNVINGNTKRVSQKTIDKITAILKEQNYVPNMGSMMLSGRGSRIIGVVLGFTYAHGMQSLQDPFLNALRKDRIAVSIYLVNGIKLQGQVESFDQFVILLKNQVSQMVYKHAISTIVPARAVTISPAEDKEEEAPVAEE